jgi:hypothetical protein
LYSPKVNLIDCVELSAGTGYVFGRFLLLIYYESAVSGMSIVKN